MQTNDVDNLKIIGNELAHHVTDILKTTKTLNIDWTDDNHMYMAEHIDLDGLGVKYSSVDCEIHQKYAHITFRFLVCDDNVLKQRLTDLGLDVGEVWFQAIGRVSNLGNLNDYEGVLSYLRALEDENGDVIDEAVVWDKRHALDDEDGDVIDEAVVWDTRQELNTSAFANYYALTSTHLCDDKVLETTAEHINTWSSQDTHFMLLRR